MILLLILALNPFRKTATHLTKGNTVGIIYMSTFALSTQIFHWTSLCT